MPPKKSNLNNASSKGSRRTTQPQRSVGKVLQLDSSTPKITPSNLDNQPSQDENITTGFYGFQSIDEYDVPYIIRIINGEWMKFVSVKIAETQLLSSYLNRLNPAIYSVCTLIDADHITESEAVFLNYINQTYIDNTESILVGKDYIVCLEDLHEFYKFIKICYKILLLDTTPEVQNKCGFIVINSDSVVPYVYKDGTQYLPAFYFEDDNGILKNQSIELKNWELSYLKFCCYVQGVQTDYFANDSMSVVSFDELKKYYPSESHIKEYFLSEDNIDVELLNYNNTTHVNPQGCWIRIPPPFAVPIDEMLNNCQNGLSSNLLDSNTNNSQAQPLLQEQQQQQDQQQQITITTQINQCHCDQSLHDDFTNSRKRKTAMPAIISKVSTRPSNYVSPTLPEATVVVFTIIPKLDLESETTKEQPYKVALKTIDQKLITCVNLEAYKYTDWLVPLNELVRLVFRATRSILRCVNTFHDLGITMYHGNSLQMDLLTKRVTFMSSDFDKTPMALLNDIRRVWKQFVSAMLNDPPNRPDPDLAYVFHRTHDAQHLPKLE